MKACLLESLALFCPNANSFRRFQANSYAAAGADLGNQQPHRVAAGSRRPGVQPAHRAPHLRRRRQSLPGGGGVARGGAPGYSRATRPRCADHWQRLRSSHPGVAERLADQLRALEGSAWAREALGEDFLKIYLAIKQAEYRAFMGEVGEQDWRWYLNQA